MDYTNDNIIDNLFRISGKVTSGRQLGRTVSMPTANLLTSEDISSIPSGVYATELLLEQRLLKGISHIGRRPSVDKDDDITIETYIFDFNEDIYDKQVCLIGHMFIRDTIEFNSLDDVKKQVDLDILAAMEYFKTV